MKKTNFLDPRSLTDEQLKPFFNEWNRRYQKIYREKNPEKVKKFIENHWKKKLMKEVMENGKEQENRVLARGPFGLFFEHRLYH